MKSLPLAILLKSLQYFLIVPHTFCSRGDQVPPSLPDAAILSLSKYTRPKQICFSHLQHELQLKNPEFLEVNGVYFRLVKFIFQTLVRNQPIILPENFMAQIMHCSNLRELYLESCNIHVLTTASDSEQRLRLEFLSFTDCDLRTTALVNLLSYAVTLNELHFSECAFDQDFDGMDVVVGTTIGCVIYDG